MALKRVLIVNKSFPEIGLEILNKKVEPIVVPHLDYEPESLPAIKKAVQGCDAIIWNTKHQLTGEILDLAGPRLKAISTMSSGTDHINLKDVFTRGLLLGNTPHVLDNCVADIAIGLFIAAARRFKEGINEIMSGEWKYGVQWSLGQDISGSTVGVIGLGGIGQAVVRRLKGFDVARLLNILQIFLSFIQSYCCTYIAKTLEVDRVSLEQLLRESDFVLLSCPLTDDTKHIINPATLKLMKRNTVLVNIGRGGLVDQEALYNALKEGQIFSAGLDVVTPEPLPKDHPLLTLPNCFIVPHLGSATIATRNAMATISAKNILQALEGQPMMYPVS